MMTSLATMIRYMAKTNLPAVHHIYPRASGRLPARPDDDCREMPIHDRRNDTEPCSLDVEGFELVHRSTTFEDYFDTGAVGKSYYPEVEALVVEWTGATNVIAFDHNVRSQTRALARTGGIREPVQFVHNDYTAESGPRRAVAIMEEAEPERDLRLDRYAFINVWRPIHGPVRDMPLAVCDSRSVLPNDLIATEIRHYSDAGRLQPGHRGEIYSVSFNPAHRWSYFSEMQNDEVLLLKCFDSLEDGTARFTPHTAITDPVHQQAAHARESIEVRTLAIF